MTSHVQRSYTRIYHIIITTQYFFSYFYTSGQASWPQAFMLGTIGGTIEVGKFTLNSIANEALSDDLF
jgi:hypothetical protein